MKRIDRIKKTYGVEFYFCAKYYKFYEYMSSPHFRPTAREIVCTFPDLCADDTLMSVTRMKIILRLSRVHQAASQERCPC